MILRYILFFFFNDTATTEIYTLSLHDALPILRNAGDVVCCGSCPTGCRIDAKQATHVSELPRAAAAGARVRAGARVTRVLVEGGRAAGVRCRIAGRDDPYEVRARAVVLAAGAFGTPRLLLRGR